MKIKTLLLYFAGWRILLFVFLLLAIQIIPLEQGFLGGGLINYLKNPFLYSWLNYDGEHFFYIARQGYQPLTYFYFPLYPILINFFQSVFSRSILGAVIAGLTISNLAFLLGLYGLVKLVRLDYERNIALITLFLLLLFPTSFYFGSYYSEGLFFALAVWAFYFARVKSWLFASILGLLAAMTRVVGIVLFPALLAEYFAAGISVKGKQNISANLLFLLIIPLGLIFYMFYLKLQTGDPLGFVHDSVIFGQQRSSNFVLLPQVFYRYFFKILPNINYDYFPVVFSTFLEILTACIFLVLALLAFFKLRLSYALYLFLGYLVPTLSGSFSSLPRYVLVLFPGFIIAAIYLQKLNKSINAIFFLILLTLLGVASSLFLRGYWIS